MHPAPPAPNPPPLWQRLRALFARIIAVIGAPALIAALTFAPRTRTEIVRQIALIEILARKLLLAEAAALDPPTERGPRHTEITLAASGLYMLHQRRTRSPPRPRAIDLADPETWSARFALAIPRDGRIVANRNAPRIRALWGDAPAPPERSSTPHRRNSEAFLIARRAEALRRMLNDPAPHVRRLARSRRVGVARCPRVVTRYALSAPRRFIGDRYDPRLTIDIFSVAVRAQALLNTS